MKWKYNELGHDEPIEITEAEILEWYWEYWYQQMCNKFGKEHVANNYTEHDCIEDWVVVNWAWKSENTS